MHVDINLFPVSLFFFFVFSQKKEMVDYGPSAGGAAPCRMAIRPIARIHLVVMAFILRVQHPNLQTAMFTMKGHAGGHFKDVMSCHHFKDGRSEVKHTK